MDYIGLDPTVGLECTSCQHIVRLPYSELLNKVLEAVPMACQGCGRPLNHDWTTVNIVQNIIKRRMREMHEADAAQAADA